MTRSTGATVQTLVLAAVSAGAAVLCFCALRSTSGPLWLLALAGGILLGIFAFICGLAAMQTVGRAPCPRCSESIFGLELKGAQKPARCSKCSLYVMGKDRVIQAVSDDYVDDEPTFAVTLGGGALHWPPGCCVCGEAATRVLDVVAKDSQTGTNAAIFAAGLAVGSLAVRTGGGTTYTLRVPHCAAHEQGAALKIEGGGKPPHQLLFRSYAYQRRFTELNPPPSTGGA